MQTGAGEDDHGVLDPAEEGLRPEGALRVPPGPGGGPEPDHADRVADRNARLKRVRTTRRTLDRARGAYLEAVIDSYDAGDSPTSIAEAAGLSEGAIRQTVKRNRSDG